MSELTLESLLGLARQFYPSGFPVEKDDYSQPQLAHQLTPEHERWRAAWREALEWREWDPLLDALEAAFPAEGVRDATQPWHSACRRVCLYIKKPLAEGGQTIIRVAAAISVLAPLYVTFVTTRTAKPSKRASEPQFSFEPPEEVQAHADMLAKLVEQELRCRPFPLKFADVTVADIRVGYRNSMKPVTLLDALFSDDLVNLP
jgi:hypothetical protein